MPPTRPSGNRLHALRDLGQSVWYDCVRRDLLDSGELDRMIRDDGLAGLTSNPVIFDQAVTGTDLYEEAIRAYLLEEPDTDPETLFNRVAMDDLRRAADAFMPLYRETGGGDGFVSLEVSPELAHDTDATVREAQALFARMDRPNAMIKVPGTRAGVAALETLIAEGVNVNMTLLFSVPRYKQVLEGWMRGMEIRLERGDPLDRVASVASFFVSRVDTAVDRLLDERIREGRPVEHLHGTLAIANAKLAYAHFRDQRGGARYSRLEAAGAHPQRLLWASTGTRNSDYSDVHYVESLIGEHTVSTLPPDTYRAFLDHGVATSTLAEGLDEARGRIASLADLGIDLESVTDRLEADGIRGFRDAFDHLLGALAEVRDRLRAST
ncbi:transaldolase [Thioalkalivibrio thiocyanodenitrificans]|uniref:transaldolase n=1 Tax=Thioalkalivibrio thiocyanodenitrificans TaxID=243063 RepID=UPI0003A29EFF|nr:transaldolase [Thioalkalivibrio thiocyanodenitrificans]